MQLLYRLKAKYKPRKVTTRPELVDQGVELSVRHLKQYFKFGHGASAFKTKAVHDVSFDIKKGECFGVVGESGCGKTTTGRSLIRLYNITSGSVYFEGVRVSAGTRWNEKEIKWSRIKGNNKIKALRQECKNVIEELSDTTGSMTKIAELDKEKADIEAELIVLKEEYRQRTWQASNIRDEEEKALKVAEINQEYNTEVDNRNKRLAVIEIERNRLLETKKAAGKQTLTPDILDKINAVKKEYDEKINEIKEHILQTEREQVEIINQAKYDNRHVDKKLMSKMQMIFQDPVDSLDPRMTVEDIIQEGLHIQGEYNRYKNSLKVKEALIKVGLLPE